MKANFFNLTLACLVLCRLSYCNQEEDIHRRLETLMKEMSGGEFEDKKCISCSSSQVNIPDSLPELLVFVSFSLPEGVWLSLSQDLEKIGGTFVLRGIPQNSFKELAQRIYKLRQNGVNADIQLHPQLFDEYVIQKVPTFVVTDGTHWDKISGTLSLEYVLGEIQKNGDTKIAKKLLNKLQVGKL